MAAAVGTRRRRSGGAQTAKRAPAAASAKPVGRPRRLSREMIIDASIRLLKQYSAEGLTLARVAQKLDTVSMALYNYFPSREALLAEVASHIAKQFTMPPRQPDQDWKQTLRDWLWTLRALGEKYPVLFKVSGMDGRTSAGWLRITRIPGMVLHDLGLRGKELAVANWLFCMKAHALVQAEVTDAGFHSPVSLSHLEELEPDEQQHFLMLRPFHGEITGADIMEAGFADLIDSVERTLQSASSLAAAPATARRKSRSTR